MLLRTFIILSLISCGAQRLEFETRRSPRTSAQAPVNPSSWNPTGQGSLNNPTAINTNINEPSPSSSISGYCAPSSVQSLSSQGSESVKTIQKDQFTIYYPGQLASRNCKHIAVSWGNGTGRSGGSAYRKLHEFWASHGIIVIASHSGSTGSGGPIVAGIDLLESLKADSNSLFYSKIPEKFIVSGQSQGGMGASAAARDPRVETAIPMGGAGPISSKPSLFVTADGDYLKSLVNTSFSSSAQGSLFVSSQGGSHPSVPFTAAAKALGVAWSQCAILKDKASCDAVLKGCSLCEELSISTKKSKN